MERLIPVPALQNAVRLLPAKNKRWRCYHCNAPKGVEFSSQTPECPSCHRVNSPLIIELTDIHWIGPHPDGAMPGQFANDKKGVACMPRRPTVAGIMATGALEAVTCPACLESEAYRTAWAAYADVWPDFADNHRRSACPVI